MSYGATITTISPTTLVPGASFTVSGANFGATVGANTLKVAGVAATITSATTTQLTATVPCVSSGTQAVVVTANSVTSPSVNASVAGSVRTLAVGQGVVTTTAAASACNELPAANGSARYLVAVFSAATSQNTTNDVELRGNPIVAAAPFADRGAGGPVTAAPRLNASRAATVTVDAAQAAHDREHLSRLEAGRTLYQQLRSAGYRAPATPTRTRTAALRYANALGDSRVFFYNYTCSDTTKRIGAKAIYVGTKAVKIGRAHV